MLGPRRSISVAGLVRHGAPARQSCAGRALSRVYGARFRESDVETVIGAVVEGGRFAEQRLALREVGFMGLVRVFF